MTLCSTGSVTAAAALLDAGGAEAAVEYDSWMASVARKFRKSVHAGCGALAEQEKASRPPIMAVGSPAPPGTDGNGKKPRSGRFFWSGVREPITPGSQAPMSSMAALWFATRPADEPAPCWADVVRKPSLNGLVAAKACRS